jgi:ParB-like chromosome segregation protein Spo0J
VSEPRIVRIETVPIDSVRLDDQNARKHPDRNVKAITDSLVRFGQQKPIVAMEDGTVIAGNGTYAAAKALGWTEI